MGLFSFIKDAGASLFGMKTSEEKQEEARQGNEAKIREFVSQFNLNFTDLGISFSGEDDDTVTLTGEAATQEDKEKLILAIGNIKGIAQVDDQLTVPEPKPEAVFYTVVRGDSLSKIAKTHYGDYKRYTEIFEANRPMLTHPDKIYPGQVLRIPNAEA